MIVRNSKIVEGNSIFPKQNEYVLGYLVFPVGHLIELSVAFILGSHLIYDDEPTSLDDENRPYRLNIEVEHPCPD